jgi:enoyl-CoA hydratase
MGFTRRTPTKPTIAAIGGWCLAGGLELALWCDLRVAAQGSTLGFPERRWGVPLIDGGTQRLPRIVGMGRALDLILTGRLVATDEALAMGLLSEVVPAGEHLTRALEMAEGLAAFPQETMLADRRAALEGLGLPLADGLALEAQAGPAVFADAVAGAARFAGGEGRGGAGAGV